MHLRKNNVVVVGVVVFWAVIMCSLEVRGFRSSCSRNVHFG